MSTPPPIKYPLDLTGKSSDNLITGEGHSLASAPNRAFVPSYGPFFTRSLVVRSLPDGTVLKKDIQYKAVQLFVDATEKTGEEICSVLVITDEELGSEFEIDYQVLGGDYSASTYAIEQMINTLSIDDRAVRWGDIIGKPEEFAPAPHLHDLGDLYGFEYLTAALEQLRQSILIGDEASHEAIYQYIDHQDGLIQETVDNNSQELTNHKTDFNNPHRVTKAQVGLGDVDNYATATTTAAKEGKATNLFMTPATTKAAITEQAGSLLQQHVNDHTNPHQVTKAQVGLGSVENHGIASQAEAEAGTINTAYMTPLRTAQAITKQAVNPLNNHLGDTANPHRVTKAQVGLGSVQDYGVASTSEAVAGTSNTKYMTPALTKAAIADQAGTLLQNHINDHGNPHQVTKAQVGLGSVSNYGIASQAQAEAGSVNTEYMTPLRTSQAITKQAVTPLNSHVNNHSNPHNVTKAQVGLGSADNTSDKNKPISTATQSALNKKIESGDSPRFQTVYVGNDTTMALYESGTNNLMLRSGSAANPRYFSHTSGGDLTVQGQVIASGGFKPSDRRLKTDIEDAQARPLWRKAKYKTWTYKKDGSDGRGVISQQIKRFAPEYTRSYEEPDTGKKRLAVNYEALAFEMVMAAGSEIDRLTKDNKALVKSVEKLQKEVKKLSDRASGK